MKRIFTPFLTTLAIVLFFVSVNTAINAQSPVVHYMFDNSITDASGNGYDLTPEGAFVPAFEEDSAGIMTIALTVPGANG